MPKTNTGRTTDTEANVARRIEHEREKLGMSYEALAKAMTGVGCKVQATAIHKIEKGDKQTGKLRRITVNELAAFAEIFTNGDVAELLKPMELIEQERAHELAQEWIAATVALDDAHASVVRAAVRLGEIARSSPETYEFVAYKWAAASPGRQWFGDAEFDEVDDKQLVHLTELGNAFWEQALLVIDHIAQKNETGNG